MDVENEITLSQDETSQQDVDVDHGMKITVLREQLKNVLTQNTQLKSENE